MADVNPAIKELVTTFIEQARAILKDDKSPEMRLIQLLQPIADGDKEKVEQDILYTDIGLMIKDESPYGAKTAGFPDRSEVSTPAGRRMYMTGWLRDFNVPEGKENETFDDKADNLEWNSCLFWEFGGRLRYEVVLKSDGEPEYEGEKKKVVMLKEPMRHKITKAVCLEYEYLSKVDGKPRKSALFWGYRGASDS